VTEYYRLTNSVMLGKASAYVDESVAGGFIGADFEIHEDLTGKLPEDWRAFNKAYIPIFLANVPGKTKVAAGLACGMSPAAGPPPPASTCPSCAWPASSRATDKVDGCSTGCAAGTSATS